MRFVRVVRVLGVAVGALTAVVVTAQPAAAHGVGGVQPSNFETTVNGTTPRVAGLTVRVIDLGNELELRNDSGTEVFVLGYQGEPYLRVGPHGVFENRRSPATYLNRTRNGQTHVPADADPAAAPEWNRIDTGTVARWHDHRAHWMGTEDPPEVARAPDQRHVIDHWSFQLRRGSQNITVTGDLLWVPGPSPWGWLVGAAAVAGLVVALSRTRVWRWVLVGALAVLAVSETAHVIGTWTATTASFASKLGASVYSLGGVALAVVAIVWLIVRPPSNAIPAVLFAGLIVAVAGGLADLTTLTRSQLPTDAPASIARTEVMLALGLGAGLAASAALRLRPPVPPRRQASAKIEEPTPVS
ncbi:MAG TPA: hypothetical protein VFA62_08610 [Acidimicrobiia bacterium]|nr:hypothetical protein [Acidimicrobiia bacterium]